MFTPQPDARSGRADAPHCDRDGSPAAEPQPQDQPNGVAPADWRVRKVIALLGGDLRRHWTVEELAKPFDLTPRHLERLFKAATGSCPLQYLKALRLERALAELTASEKGVGQIAAEVGYHPQSRHFFRDFKARYAMSPAECRRQLREWAEQCGAAGA